MLNDQLARAAPAAGALSPGGVRVGAVPRRPAPPTARGLELLALAFRLPPPPTGLRGAATEVMSDLIREQGLPRGSPSWHAAFQDLLQPVADAAAAACREAEDGYLQARLALERSRAAREAREDGRLIAMLERGAERLMAHAAELLIVAHARREEARGAARAIARARHGVPGASPAER